MVPEIIDMDMPVEGVFHNLVIAQIKKDYAGQGQKVMNAMWGAGQMMFNKILVLADEHVKIQDYESLARYAFRNMDVINDVTTSTGPMDVLDHSCNKLGFGGKMAIDGTLKFDEEIHNINHLNIQPVVLPDGFADHFNGVQKINDSLLKKEIPCLILSVKKEKTGHVRELHEQICSSPEVEGVKMILYVEHTVDADDIPVSLWRLCNNMDPKRDTILHQRGSLKEPGKNFCCIGLDGTIKTKEFDNFQRDWPNIIVADDATISAVDEKWEKLGIGEFVPSPSLKFKSQMYGEEAVVSL